MSDKVDNRQNDYRRDHRPQRTVASQSNRLLTPKGVEKPPFEKVLEDTQQDLNWPQPTAQSTATETQQAVRGAVSQQERESRPKDDADKRFRDKKSDRDDPSGKSESSSSTVRAKEADRKVIGRGDLSERGHGQGGQGGNSFRGDSQGRQQGRGTSLATDLGLTKAQALAQTAKSKFEAELQVAQSMMPATLSASAAAASGIAAPKMLPKAVLDQIVRYCRVITKTDGDKEIDMQLHDELFKGLRLKVSVTEGRVQATFITVSPEVGQLFRAQKSDLTRALEEKGIAVESLNVLVA